MKRSRYTVAIPKLSKTTRVLAESPREAVQRAIVREFGRRAHWWGPTLSPWRLENDGYEYGQVIRPSPAGGHNCLTPQICVEVEQGW